MNRFGAMFWLVLVVVSGFATFKAKYAIQDVEDELTKVRRQTVSAQSEIRTLNAEWTYLNQPERLAELNRKFLNLTPIVPKQLQQRVEDMPLRAPPATPELVAAAVSPAVPEAVATGSSVAPPAKPTVIAAAAPRPAPVQPPMPAAASASSPRATPVAARVPAPRVQLAKAGPASLNSLIAQIAEVH